ncbi:MAG: GTP 3',8-cyclase MoaA [Myxococcota bacterium]|nr:GTP 3',8-cyclase MoaA [Myxococcota bacterium]
MNPGKGSLQDSFGRKHTYLRVSVTDRCNFRCTYCMPEEGLEWLDRKELLSYEEIVRLVGLFVKTGISRVRITGGEPTIRRDLPRLVEGLAACDGLDDLSMTTNAQQLDGMVEALAAAGLNRLNVSLDSLDSERFSRLTRGGDLDRVLRGIQAALAAGLSPVKINAVVLQGENEDDLEPLVHWASQNPDQIQLRFIEYMPFETRWHRCVPGARLRERLSESWSLVPVEQVFGGGPAQHWRVAETGLIVGFISPLSERFCGSCNRLRLSADGHLRTCLSDDGTPSLREPMRAGESDAQLIDRIRAMVAGKREGHGCEVEGGRPFEGVMTRVGG